MAGSAWPWGPPGRNVRLATGSAWPWGPPGHNVRLAMRSAWPWGPPGHGVCQKTLQLACKQQSAVP
eukprot:351336-Chlamydomonas_euryale.AAC.3